MNRPMTATAIVPALALATPAVNAKGCIKGAVVAASPAITWAVDMASRGAAGCLGRGNSVLIPARCAYFLGG
jgi:hypothetical protein